MYFSHFPPKNNFNYFIVNIGFFHKGFMRENQSIESNKVRKKIVVIRRSKCIVVVN